MSKYTELDKHLKKIRNNRGYDLYKTILESQKKIDEFYGEEISENNMMLRKYKLESYISRRNILYFPIIITIIFGLLVNLVFAEFDGFSDFFKLHEELEAIPVGVEGVGMLDLAGLYIMLYMLLIVITGVFVCIFFIPFPPLYFLFDMGKIREKQIEYELKILEVKIDERIKENKNGKGYDGRKNSTYGSILLLSIVSLFVILLIVINKLTPSIDGIFALVIIIGMIGYIALIINYT